MSPLARGRAILGGSAGNLVEWYDWFVYASFSLYFAKTFFPAGDRTAQLLQASAVFAVGFLARPLGAWMLGVYADRAGRRAALILSVGLMAGGSAAIAVLPGHAAIGPAAPALLTLARLIQGLSAGGEYGASATYLSEMAEGRRRGFWSSFQFATILGGQLLALGVLIVLQHVLSRADLEAWGWRIPFAGGAVLALAVALIQARLGETGHFETARQDGARRGDTAALILGHPKETAIVFVLSSAGGLGFYAYTTYMQKFLTNTAGFAPETATQISAASLVFYLLIIPLFGLLGDAVGRRGLLIAAFGLGAAIAWPVMTALAHARSEAGALALVCAAISVLAGYSAVNAVVKAELFPTRIRTLGVAFPYALGNAVFGGTAEYVALSFRQAGHESGFFVYLAVVQAAGCLAAIWMPDPERRGHMAEA